MKELVGENHTCDDLRKGNTTIMGWPDMCGKADLRNVNSLGANR